MSAFPAPALASDPDTARDERLLASALALLARPDRDAFVRFTGATSARMEALVLRCGDEQRSADLLHRVHLELWNRAPAYDPADDAVEWVLDVIEDVRAGQA